ncbi:MAG: MaoC family dehydratase N-terminal domain-containing protein [Chloroflexi bacterium]|nr:MaoC family dehydratase N-terminal domain-containing protein [Chloroflexota bacterium]
MTQRHAVITQEMVEDVRRRIGVEHHPTALFNTQATRDAIRHFCDGIGDANPLFRDPAYARKSRYGGIVAPPCFLGSVYWVTGRVGFPGIHAWNAGSDWEFCLPVREGDTLSCSTRLVDVQEKRSRAAGRSFIEYVEGVYRNQTGEMVGKCLGWSVRVERGAAGERGRYRDVQPASHASEELEAVYRAYDQEEIRGATPRYWEDVKEGEELPPVVKGPLSLRDIYAWLIGAGSPYIRAHRFALEYQRQHPAVGMVDSTTGAVDVPELVHMERSRAQEVGLPGPYDYGPQRVSWLGHLMTNWTGDDGFLRRIRVELRRFNFVGDTTWCRGRVKGKRVDKGEHLVDMEIWAENQRREVTAVGLAVVALPLRGS